jgi:N utilization substance protein B
MREVFDMVVEERKQGENLSRNQMQGKLMVCIYQYLLHVNMLEKPNMNEIIEGVFEMPVSKCDPFVKKCIKAVMLHAQDAIEAISPLLKQWTFERLGYIERAILILAYVQYKYLETPKPIVIDIAVKLARRYADEDSYKFINAVLQNVQ